LSDQTILCVNLKLCGHVDEFGWAAEAIQILEGELDYVLLTSLNLHLKIIKLKSAISSNFHSACNSLVLKLIFETDSRNCLVFRKQLEALLVKHRKR